MWGRIISSLLGLWLMIAPGVLKYSSAAADNGYIIGPVIITFSVVAFWEATDIVRKWNYPLGIWLLLAPWILEYPETAAIGSDMISGLMLLIFTSLKRNFSHSYGGGWSSLWQKHPEHLEN